jgi:hypothetical protein
VRTYLKYSSEGHVAQVKEPDISRAFQVDKRLEKFDMKLSDVSAHTLKILEIIWEEESNIKTKKQKEVQRRIKNAG